MTGEQNLQKLLEEMTPELNMGYFVFITSSEVDLVNRRDTICEFKEKEGITFVITKDKADELGLEYNFVASWITLKIHSSLQAVGLTAIISTAFAKAQISCNIIAGFYHDHLFIDHKDAIVAIELLERISKNYRSFI